MFLSLIVALSALLLFYLSFILLKKPTIFKPLLPKTAEKNGLNFLAFYGKLFFALAILGVITCFLQLTWLQFSYCLALFLFSAGFSFTLLRRMK